MPCLDSSSVSGTDDGGTDDGETTTGYYVKVTKDGVVKQWSTVVATNSTALNSFSINAIDLSSSMRLDLLEFSEIGIYNFSWVKVVCEYTEGIEDFSSTYSDLNISDGNITVTELDKTNKTIKGTFNFIGKNEEMTSTKVFTKGEFFVKYTVQ